MDDLDRGIDVIGFVGGGILCYWRDVFWFLCKGIVFLNRLVEGVYW